jgi:hypothetical protein
MKSLFAVTGVFEMLAGLGFVIAPSLSSKLLFDSSLQDMGQTNVVRVLGLALLALGIAFWRARNDVQSPAAHGLGIAMFVYNTGVAVLVVASAVGWRVTAPALWPVFGIHAGLAIWCGSSLRTAAALKQRPTVNR